jgi:hypothetical protein
MASVLIVIIAVAAVGGVVAVVARALGQLTWGQQVDLILMSLLPSPGDPTRVQHRADFTKVRLVGIDTRDDVLHLHVQRDLTRAWGRLDCHSNVIEDLAALVRVLDDEAPLLLHTADDGSVSLFGPHRLFLEVHSVDWHEGASRCGDAARGRPEGIIASPSRSVGEA